MIIGVEKADPFAKQPGNHSFERRKPAELALRPQSPDTPANKSATRDAAQQDVFLREVDDALREDQLLGFVKRYGLRLGLAIAAGLLGLAGYLWWEQSGKESSGQRSEEFSVALDRIEAGSLDAGSKALDPLAAEGGDGSQAAAALMKAAIALEQGKAAEAVKGFAAVAADENAPQPLRDLATIREVAANFDAMPPQQVVDRLKPLAVPGNAWFGSAGELTGIAYMRLGKNDLAGPIFAAVARDKDTPETLKRRARQMAGLLGVDAIDDAAKIAAEAAGEGQPQQ